MERSEEVVSMLKKTVFFREIRGLEDEETELTEENNSKRMLHKNKKCHILCVFHTAHNPECYYFFFLNRRRNKIVF